MTKQHQALFTELTAQQAAAIQGGLKFRLDSVDIVRAGGDDFSGDDPLITVNGTTVFRAANISDNNFFNVGRTFDFRNANSLKISAFDEDEPAKGNPNDLLQSFTFTGPGKVSKTFENEFSTYLVKGVVLP